MKTFKQIVSEVAQPVAGDEKRFKDKHKVDTIGDPQNNGDKLYKGSEIKKDKSKIASYEDGEDTKVYEEVEGVDEKIDVYKAMKARYGKDFKKKSPEEVASDKKSERIEKDKKSYSDMRKSMGMNDYETTKKIVGEKIDVEKAMRDRYQGMKGDYKKKSPEQVQAEKDAAKKKMKNEDIDLDEKKLTPAEMKKREEIAKAIERENPNMPMGKKMAIATATAKKVAESIHEDIKNKIAVYRPDGSFVGLMDNFSAAQRKYPGHTFHSIETKPIKEATEDENIAKVNAIASNLKSMTKSSTKPKMPHVNDGLTGKAKDMFSVESFDPEGEMAKSDMRAIAHKALQLHSMMDDDQQLESWLQAKITKAKYMIDSVYDYVMYNMPDEDDEPAEDYMSALPYPNRPVGAGMYGEETGYKYPMTYAKFGSNKERQLTKHIKHTHIMFPEKPTTPERVRYVVANSPEHKKLKVDGYEITHYGEHKKEKEEAKEKAAARKTTSEAADLDTANVDKEVMHDCAKHVVHEKWGPGDCVPGMHTILETAKGIGIVTYYDVMFEHGLEQNVPADDLEVILSESHGHKKMKEELTPAQKKHIDKNNNGEIDSKDFELLRKKK